LGKAQVADPPQRGAFGRPAKVNQGLFQEIVMNAMKVLGLLCLVGAVLASGGCSKEVTCVFSNTTDQTVNAQILIQGEIPIDVGPLAPKSSGYEEKIKIKNSDLPQTVTFQGGNHSRSQSINESTEDRIWVDFIPFEPYIQVRTSKKMSITQKEEKTVGPVPVQQGTVVTP
jgi:hypothetical protein